MIKGLDELKENLIKLDNNEEIFFNIHFTITDDLHKYCLDLNDKILQIDKSNVMFTVDSLHLPHMTLYTGKINNKESLEEVLRVTSKLATTFKYKEEELTKPYIHGFKNKWVFIDIENNNNIIEFKRQLEIDLKNKIIPVDWDVVGNTSHITVGHLFNVNNEIQELINNFPTPPLLKTIAIEVSIGGLRGTCLGSLKTFYID